MSHEEVTPMRLLLVLTAAWTLALSAAGSATEVHWTAAHGMAPQGVLCAPAACDLDGDADLDVAVLPISVVSGDGFIWWNVGTPEVPTWEMDPTVFIGIPEDCYDRRGCLGDVDSDGDQDLVLGCPEGDLRLIWNVGTPQVPVWQYDGAPFASISPSLRPKPHFGDFDADGDLDISMTYWGATTYYIENVGSPTDPNWVFQGSLGWGIVPYGSTPCMASGDLDGDGDLDLVGQGGIGPQAWENIGTPQEFLYVENPSLILGVAEPDDGSKGVELLDIDADGDLDLLIAGWSWDGNYLYLCERFTPVESRSWGVIKAMYR